MPMQPLDPSLFGGSSASHTTLQPAVDAADTDVLPKGTHVWYLHRSGAWQPARVTQVDLTDPAGAFYQIEMLDDGTIRDTERPRLKKRQPEQQVPPPRDARDLPGAFPPSATHLQPAAGANNPSPAHVTGHAQAMLNPSQPNFGSIGTPATAWQQHFVPHYPAQGQAPAGLTVPQHHHPYPAQYYPANMQGSSPPASPVARKRATNDELLWASRQHDCSASAAASNECAQHRGGQLFGSVQGTVGDVGSCCAQIQGSHAQSQRQDGHVWGDFHHSGHQRAKAVHCVTRSSNAVASHQRSVHEHSEDEWGEFVAVRDSCNGQQACVNASCASDPLSQNKSVTVTDLPPQQVQQSPQASGLVSCSPVAHSEGAVQPRDESWGEFTAAAVPQPPTCLPPWAFCTSPTADFQNSQAEHRCASSTVGTGGPTSSEGAAVCDTRSVAGCALPLPADLFSRPESMASQSTPAKLPVPRSLHAIHSPDADAGASVPDSAAKSKESCSRASCPTTIPSTSGRARTGCTTAADVVADKGEFGAAHRSGSAAVSPFAVSAAGTLHDTTERQRSEPFSGVAVVAEASGLPTSITHSCASEFASAERQLEGACVPRGFSARARTHKASAVCEGFQGETAYEQHHLYSHASEEELVWGSGTYSEALLHQDIGSAVPRRSHGSISMPPLQVVTQNASMRVSAERCGGGAQKVSRQTSILWPQRSACGEATEPSGDGSESLDELGFTTPTSPEDLSYDEAQAINSLFQRSSSSGNQLLAYSKAAAAKVVENPDPVPTVTPRALSGEAEAQGGADGLMQLASCSPVSPSCVAQLSVHDSHVYLRVHGGVDDTAMLAMGKQSCAQDEGDAVDTQSAVRGLDDAGQNVLEGAEEEVGRSMAELATSSEAACAAGSMECEAAAQNAAVAGQQCQHADASAGIDEKSSVDSAGSESKCVKSGAEEGAEASRNVPEGECAAHSSASQGADAADGGEPATPSCRSDEASSPTYVFARALSLSLKRIPESVTGTADASGQPTGARAVQAHVCERLARKGLHVLALAEAFAQVGKAERLPAATIVGTAPPSFWPSIAVVHKLSRHILYHCTAQATGDSENGVSAWSSKTAPVVPQLSSAAMVEPMTARGGARAQSARPSESARRRKTQKKEPIVVDFPRELPSEKHAFRFRKGFDILDSAAEEETEEVVMYTSSIASLRKTAADTRRVRQILDAFQVQYQEVDLALQPRMRRRMLEISDDFNALPQLHCRGKLVGDGDTCFDLHDFGELMPILINGETPRAPDEQPSASESPLSSCPDAAAGMRHIFNAPESCDSPCSAGPREVEKLELPGELLYKLRVAVDSAALQACLAEVPSVDDEELAGAGGSGEQGGDVPLCALTGLPCGGWKVDRVDASFTAADVKTSASESRPLEEDSGRGVIAAAANLWLSLVDEDLPSLGGSV